MDIVVYLAMTAAEFQEKGRDYPHIAWMACHFSPYGTGLSNLPPALPQGSILMLNDRTPVAGHDPAQIARQMQELAEEFSCDGIVLDFQRPNDPQTRRIASCVCDLPCPVAVTPAYAEGLAGAVLLPPVPMTTLPEDHFAPWKGREIWLEVAPECHCIRITKEGSRESEDLRPDFPCPHIDAKLHCRYGMDIQKDYVDFHLRRDEEQLRALLKTSESFGVYRFVGLYQELSAFAQWDAADTARFQP